MEVTINNFDELLPQIEASIDRCDFMAIDCELSGLTVSDDKDNCFEPVEDRYVHVRESASKFLVIQFGLCPFFYDPVKDEFTHEGYNFYTFPRQLDGKGPNTRFLCEASSLEFLANCGFDFNKLLYEGIPYLTFEAEDKMKAELEKRVALHSSDENSNPLNVPESYKRFVDSTETRLQRFLASSLQEMTIDGVSAFQRKLVFHNLKPKFSSKLYFESVQAVNEEEEEHEPSSKPETEEMASTPTDIPDPDTPANTENGKTQPSRAVSKIRILRVFKLDEAEQIVRDNEKKRAQLESIDKHVGFSRVIRKISQSAKLVVGHNMLLDVCHTIHQFVDPLPDNLPQYKEIVQETFPNLIDTKYMATSHPFREYVTTTVLTELMKRVHSDPFVLPNIKSVVEGAGYDLACGKSHEAGFDSYMTGCCFIAMCQHLGTLHTPKKSRVLPNSPLVMPFLNKLFMMRMSDIPYLNISGTDLTPSRSHVFFVTCPKDANQRNITQIFDPFGTVQTWWKNSTSLFVALCDKDQASIVMDNIECSSEYRIYPYATFQKMQREEKKRPLLNESPERAGDIFKKLVCGGDKSPPGEHKKKRPKTEAEKGQVKQVFDEQPSWN